VKDLEFDNVTLLLNAVDELSGDSSLLEIRNRRREHRTLTLLDRARMREEEQARAASDQATAAAQEEIDKANARLTEKVEEIRKRQDLDENTRITMSEQVRMTERRRVDVQAAAIEDAKQQKIEDARADASRDIAKIQMNIRTLAVLLPPVPALLLACGVFVSRRRAENLGVDRQRLR
jgi:ABC-2 type transport system permease protein